MPAIDGRPIFDAWSDEPWVIEGAAVRVSLICFSGVDGEPVLEARLDGRPVDGIHPDLTGRRGHTGIDLTKAQRLTSNIGVAFMGDTKGGPFDIAGDLARNWLQLPTNPNGRPNADVIKPWMNGMDVTRRLSGKWIVDFGWRLSEAEVALYEEPFRYVQEHVRPDAARKPPRGLSHPLVAARRAAAGNVASARGPAALYRHTDGSKTPLVRLD